jgi:DNA-binding response OmpR family regulator
LILLDLSGPSTDGAAFLQRLRTRWQAIPPIIVMTTNKEVYAALVAVERVICKPFHLCDLRDEVRRTLSLNAEKMLI